MPSVSCARDALKLMTRGRLARRNRRLGSPRSPEPAARRSCGEGEQRPAGVRVVVMTATRASGSTSSLRELPSGSQLSRGRQRPRSGAFSRIRARRAGRPLRRAEGGARGRYEVRRRREGEGGERSPHGACAFDAEGTLPCIRVEDVAGRSRPTQPRPSTDTRRSASRWSGSPGRTGRRRRRTSSGRPSTGRTGGTCCGIVGTVGHSFGSFREDAAHTTPEADDLARVLAAIRDAGATHVAMEVSSIALASRARPRDPLPCRRVHEPDAGPPRLPRHRWRRTRRRRRALHVLRARRRRSSTSTTRSVVSSRAACEAPLVRVSGLVGASPDDAEVAPLSPRSSAPGDRGAAPDPARRRCELVSPLVGAHNLENLLVALGIVLALDLDLERAALALKGELGAPGRLERCESPGDDVIVLVDYAHTPDALARVLSTRARRRGRPGARASSAAGGTATRTKRRPMGEAAARGADAVFVTSDNPRGESPAAIAAAIAEGLMASGFTEHDASDVARQPRGFTVELDRARAIDAAVLAAAPGDVVLICGKGHEHYQIVLDQKLPFDDRVEARRALVGAPRACSRRPRPGARDGDRDPDQHRALLRLGARRRLRGRHHPPPRRAPLCRRCRHRLARRRAGQRVPRAAGRIVRWARLCRRSRRAGGQRGRPPSRPRGAARGGRGRRGRRRRERVRRDRAVPSPPLEAGPSGAGARRRDHRERREDHDQGARARDSLRSGRLPCDRRELEQPHRTARGRARPRRTSRSRCSSSA